MHFGPGYVLHTILAYISCLYSPTVSRFQAKIIARTLRVEDGGDHATDLEGLGFGLHDETFVREAGVEAVEHGETGHLFDCDAVVRRCAI